MDLHPPNKFDDATQIANRPRKLPFSASVVSTLLLAADSVAILGSGILSFLVLVPPPAAPLEHYTLSTCFVWLTTVMLLQFAGGYRFEAALRPAAIADAIALSLGAAYLFFLAAAFSLQISESFSRLWVGGFALSSGVMILVLRFICSWTISKLVGQRLFSRNIVIIGTEEQTHRLLNHLNLQKVKFVDVVGVVPLSPAGRHALPAKSRTNTVDESVKLIRARPVDDVIVAMPWSADEAIFELVSKLRELPVNVYLSSDLVGFRLPYRRPPSHFDEVPVVELIGRPLSGWDVALKTVEDYVLGLALVVLLSPVLFATAIAVKLDSPGPVIFRQRRHGFNNREFEIFKFRTMQHDQPTSTRTIQAQKGDPRITRIGRFLRRTSLDELPQLFNVLIGNMSLVGPRPHALDHNEEYGQQIRGYFARHRMKPGITGLAQIRGFRGPTQNLESMDARVKSDVYYTENWSLGLDLKILLGTVMVVISGKNAV